MRVRPGRGCACGVVGSLFHSLPAVRRVRNRWCRRRTCERSGVEGKTPVAETSAARLRDEYIAKLDAMLKAKEAEIMEV